MYLFACPVFLDFGDYQFVMGIQSLPNLLAPCDDPCVCFPLIADMHLHYFTEIILQVRVAVNHFHSLVPAMKVVAL